MTNTNYFSSACRVISTIAALAAVFDVLFISGRTAHIILRITGIILLASSIAADRADKTYKTRTEAMSAVKTPWWDDLFTIAVLCSSLGLGYLIYVAPENLNHRKFYILIGCAVILAGVIEEKLFVKFVKTP